MLGICRLIFFYTKVITSQLLNISLMYPSFLAYLGGFPTGNPMRSSVYNNDFGDKPTVASETTAFTARVHCMYQSEPGKKKGAEKTSLRLPKLAAPVNGTTYMINDPGTVCKL